MITKTLKILMVILSINTVYAQQANERKLSIEELFRLTKDNYPSLVVSKADIQIAKQNVEVAKNAQLPTINTSLQAYYLGDAHILDKDLSNAIRVKMPHFGNTFSVDASQLIWKGGLVTNSIKAQTLREELAQLSYEANEQSVKLLVLSYYLDLYKLMNQEKVYQRNIKLAEQRLKNINQFYSQGMVTRNDVIRGELQLSNLNLAYQVIENNRQIINKQLTTTLGLNDNIRLLPDESILESIPRIMTLDKYKALADNHPTIKLTHKVIDIYSMSEKIAKSERVPSLSAFAGNKLARPILTTSPAVDMYSNGWSAGLSVNYNIDALYKAPKKIKLAQNERAKALTQSDEAERLIDIAITAAFIKYNEALTQNNTLKTNKELADENYRIMNSKYNNQLAILLDLIDASNQKIDAELQFSNSEISIIYAYYKLQKESGNLN